MKLRTDEIAEKTGMFHDTVREVLRRLHRKGLVDSVVDIEDFRYKRYGLTDEQI